MIASLTLFISWLSLFFGVLLGYICPEEFKPGEKYFEKGVFWLVVLFFVTYFFFNTVNPLALVICAILVSFFRKKLKYYSVFFAILPILYYFSKEPVLLVIAILFGLVKGSLLVADFTTTTKVKKPFSTFVLQIAKNSIVFYIVLLLFLALELLKL